MKKILFFTVFLCASALLFSRDYLASTVKGGLTLNYFEKTGASYEENFSIKNNTGHDVNGVKVRIIYKLENGEAIDYKDYVFKDIIPDGLSKKFTVRSFDQNLKFAYKYGDDNHKNLYTLFYIEYSVVEYLPKSAATNNKPEKTPDLTDKTKYQEWQKINVKNVLSLQIPPTMEVRDKNSAFEKSISLRNPVYNSNSLVIQPIGINGLEKTSFDIYSRIIVEIIEGEKGEFEYIETYSSHEREILKSSIIEDFKENVKNEEQIMGVKVVLSLSNPVIKRIGNRYAVYFKYTRKSVVANEGNVTVEKYTVLNDKNIVQFTFSYRLNEESLWKKDFDEVVKSIKFN